MVNWCDQDLKRFEELLPFYVTGMLSDAERAFCHKCLARDKIARSSLEITLLLKKAVQSVGGERDAVSKLNLLLKSLKGGGETLPASRRIKI